jgi:hypothetical protein
MTRGFNQNPFWDDRIISSGLSAGELLQPDTYPVNGTTRSCAYRLGLKTDFCHKGSPGGVLGLPVPNCPAGFGSRAPVPANPLAGIGSETTEAGVTQS